MIITFSMLYVIWNRDKLQVDDIYIKSRWHGKYGYHFILFCFGDFTEKKFPLIANESFLRLSMRKVFMLTV